MPKTLTQGLRADLLAKDRLNSLLRRKQFRPFSSRPEAPVLNEIDGQRTEARR
jgi:hypothetical protein